MARRVAAQFAEERRDRGVRGQEGAKGRDALGGDRLHRHVIPRDQRPLLDLPQALRDPLQPRLLRHDRAADFLLLLEQHTAQLRGREIGVQQVADLLQREAEVLQRKDAV